MNEKILKLTEELSAEKSVSKKAEKKAEISRVKAEEVMSENQKLCEQI